MYKTKLLLEDGGMYPGYAFGYPEAATGEVVFNTGMVGYPETLTDPSYKGQILVLTYPLIGNYGVPANGDATSLCKWFESEQVQISGLIVSEASVHYSHWNAAKSFSQWLCDEKIPALAGVDTRALTKHLRSKGTMLGKILVGKKEPRFQDPNRVNLVSQVSIPKPLVYKGGKKRILLVDCGCKASIIRSLQKRDLTIIRVPWDYDLLSEEFDGVVVSNGPGDPEKCASTIAHLKGVMELDIPTFGICLGHQLMALAAGGKRYKLKFGHRSQNQPCLENGSNRCYITSQNHSFAVDSQSLSKGWEPWFTNANDGSNEGLRHTRRPFMSVQFHPEAAPGPLDTNYLFDHFVGLLG